MSSKNNSPIIYGNTRTLKSIHPGYRRRSSSEHGDVFLLLFLSFLAYALFIYFCMPSLSSSQYTRAYNELAFQWQAVFDGLEYRYYTSFLPYIHSLLQEAMAWVGW